MLKIPINGSMIQLDKINKFIHFLGSVDDNVLSIK